MPLSTQRGTPHTEVSISRSNPQAPACTFYTTAQCLIVMGAHSYQQHQRSEQTFSRPHIADNAFYVHPSGPTTACIRQKYNFSAFLYRFRFRTPFSSLLNTRLHSNRYKFCQFLYFLPLRSLIFAGWNRSPENATKHKAKDNRIREVVRYMHHPRQQL